MFRDIRSHPVDLKRCPSDPGRISPNVRSSRNYFENGHSGGGRSVVLCAKERTQWEKHRMEQCSDRGGKYKCIRCGKRSGHEKIPGSCRGHRWLGKESNCKLQKLGAISMLVGTFFRISAVFCWIGAGNVQVMFRICCEGTFWANGNPQLMRERGEGRQSGLKK